MSGDMCTSLGNGFTNLMILKFLAFKKGAQIRLLVEGDDGLFATNAQFSPADFAQLGFKVKLKASRDPCTSSFCGLIFSESGQIVRDPLKFFAGFGWTGSFLNAGAKVMWQLLRAKALSAAYETPQCPIVGVMAREALRRTVGVQARFVRDGYHEEVAEFEVPEFAPTNSTRQLFAEKFGVTIAVQLVAEQAIREGDMRTLSQCLNTDSDHNFFADRFLSVGE